MNVSLNESGDGTGLVGGRGEGCGGERRWEIVFCVKTPLSSWVTLSQGMRPIRDGKIRVRSTRFHSKPCVGGHKIQRRERWIVRPLPHVKKFRYVEYEKYERLWKKFGGARRRFRWEDWLLCMKVGRAL